jgi:uncharacterized membrane protein YfcA
VSLDEIESLERLLKAEESHLKQWSKHLLALTAIVLSLLVNFLRGNKKNQSVIEIKHCSQADWVIFTCFIVCMLIMSVVGLTIVK